MCARCPHHGLDLKAVRRRTRLQWTNAHLPWPLACWRNVLFTDESRFQLYRADGGVMVWAGIRYGKQTQLHFIYGNLNAQKYYDEILRPIVVPFLCRRCLMFQHDDAWTNVSRICTQFLEAENVPVLPWPVYSPDMYIGLYIHLIHIEHVWDALDRCVRQRVPVPANIQQLCTAIEEEWDNVPQATINSMINSVFPVM